MQQREWWKKKKEKWSWEHQDYRKRRRCSRCSRCQSRAAYGEGYGGTVISLKPMEGTTLKQIPTLQSCGGPHITEGGQALRETYPASFPACYSVVLFFFSSPSYSNWQQVKYFLQAELVLLMIVIDKWSPCLYLQPMMFFMLFSLPVPFRNGNERADEWASGSQVRLASKLIKTAHMFVFLYIFP